MKETFGKFRYQILAFVPFLYLVVAVIIFRVDVPFWDQWEFVPLLAKAHQGNLSFNDLWLQHGDHRLLFPKIIMLILALLSRWNINLELAANLILSAGIFIAVKGEFYRIFTKLKLSRPDSFLPVLSVMIFSLSQWENWLWGWQIQIFLNILFTVLCINLLSSENLGTGKIILAAFFAVVASYSFGNGLIVWPVGLALILLKNKASWKIGRIPVFIWVVFAIPTLLLYFNNFKSDFNLSNLGHPAGLIVYSLSYLGAPLFSFAPVPAAVSGALGVILFIYLVLVTEKNPGKGTLPFVSLGAYGVYAIFSAILTAVGRMNFGLIQAISSRYISFSNLLWLAVLFLIKINLEKNRHKDYQKKDFKPLNLIFFALLLLLIINSFLRIFRFSKQHRYLSQAKEALISGKHPEYLDRLYYSGEIVKNRNETLRKYRLSIYR